MTNGYAAMQRETLSGRALEREVFNRITARLENVDPNAPGGGAAFAEALTQNSRLWRTLALDLAHRENHCPPKLRASLLSLAMFVEKHTRRVIDGQAGPQILIEINRNIIRGLTVTHAEAA